jgi:hypothetical protein
MQMCMLTRTCMGAAIGLPTAVGINFAIIGRINGVRILNYAEKVTTDIAEASHSAAWILEDVHAEILEALAAKLGNTSLDARPASTGRVGVTALPSPASGSEEADTDHVPLPSAAPADYSRVVLQLAQETRRADDAVRDLRLKTLQTLKNRSVPNMVSTRSDYLAKHPEQLDKLIEAELRKDDRTFS